VLEDFGGVKKRGDKSDREAKKLYLKILVLFKFTTTNDPTSNRPITVSINILKD
jgi:hypothetical protein